MLRAFYDGVSGVKGHQQWIDVLGHNVANVNTVGYKKNRVLFETLLSEELAGATAPREEAGGINPKQIGLGTRVSSIQTLHTKGTFEETGKKTDVAIEGDGYFVLRDGFTDTKYFTRAGAFDFDTDGTLVNPSNGYTVQGWSAERDSTTGQLKLDPITGKTTIDTGRAIDKIQINLGEVLPAKATTEVKLEGNLDAESPFAVDQIKVSFTKGVSSLIGASSGGGITTTASWLDAGFVDTPDGTITINGATFSLSTYTTPLSLMTAVNNSAAARVTMEYDPSTDKFTIKPDADDVDIVLSERADTTGCGFFSQAKIPTGTFNTSDEVKIIFTHLYDPTSTDFYLRWNAVDPDTFETINTNSYFYKPEETLGTVQYTPSQLVQSNYESYRQFELDKSTVNPSSLIIRKNGQIMPTYSYEFQNNAGTGGVDRIEVLSAISTTGEVVSGSGTLSLSTTTTPWDESNWGTGNAVDDARIRIYLDSDTYWESQDIDSDHYPTVQDLLDEINNTGLIKITYDSSSDRFTITNQRLTERTARLSYAANPPSDDGFWHRVLNRTEDATVGGLESFYINSVPITTGDTLKAEYYFSESVEAKGILQLDEDGKVMNNFKDTEAFPAIISSGEVITGVGTVDLSGGWDQFDSGRVDGVITIKTTSGTFESNPLTETYYPNIQALINAINASEANVTMTYDINTDRFTLKSDTPGDIMILSEEGEVPFFTEINMPTGRVEGGNNNGVMDLETELPDPAVDGWEWTTGIEGTGKDFFRVAVSDNQVSNESVGSVVISGGSYTGGSGARVVGEYIGTGTGSRLWFKIPANDVYNDATSTDPDFKVYVDGTEATYNTSWVFRDNLGPSAGLTGTATRTSEFDWIQFTSGNAPANGARVTVDYRRQYTFDLDSPDVDETTLQVKYNNVTLDSSSYVFLDNTGMGGLDQIQINSTVFTTSDASYEITASYKRGEARAVDVFIPNGNEGPESITFTPNINVTSYESGERPNLADTGGPVTTTLNEESDYLYKFGEMVYDSEGVSHMLSFVFERIMEKTWVWRVTNPVDLGKQVAGYGLVTFKADGTYDIDNSEIFESPSDPSAVGSRYEGIYFDPPEDPSDVGGAPPPEEGANKVKIAPDFTSLTEFAHAPSDADVASQDGYAMGVLDSFSIDSKGIIVGEYSNGRSLDLAQIAVASFTNPSGLKNQRGTMFLQTPNSGTPDIGPAGSGGRGKIVSGTLEMSNVDLTEEFTKLIIAERGFQANARVISTADRIIMELMRFRP